jgi:rfaE bifunctional protein nucleotidyltransferase chain/domain
MMLQEVHMDVRVVKTRQFGELQVDPHHIFEFPDGLFGFGDLLYSASLCIVVSSRVPFSALLRFLASFRDTVMIVDRTDVADLCSDLRADNQRIVFTNGCFDILHAGHVDYLARARAHGNVLIVGVNSDSSVQRLKGPSRPINSEHERAVVLDALRSVDMVVVFEEDTPLELIQLVQPHVLVKGGDYTEANVVGAEFVRARGGEVVLIPFVHNTSTSAIISRATR